jgi:hypothetical protein
MLLVNKTSETIESLKFRIRSRFGIKPAVSIACLNLPDGEEIDNIELLRDSDKI